MNYSIDKILRKYSNSDWIKIIEGLNTEYYTLTNLKKRTDEQIEYIRLIEKTLFILQQGEKPIGIEYNDLMSLKPLVNNLIEKGQLKIEIMKIFN